MKNGSRRPNKTPTELRILSVQISPSGQLLRGEAGSRSQPLEADQLALRPEHLKKTILKTSLPTSTITMSFLTLQEQFRVLVALTISISGLSAQETSRLTPSKTVRSSKSEKCPSKISNNLKRMITPTKRV